MKLFASATLALAVLVTGQSYAEQPKSPAADKAHGMITTPSAQQESPFDFNHMNAGSDKSDELGVPYYNGNPQ